MISKNFNKLWNVNIVRKFHIEKHKLVLGIETSCDDTCAAVLDTDKNVLSNVKKSQVEDGIKIGGVDPTISSNLHSKAIHNVVLTALKKANITNFNQLSAIAVTNKPGLINSLSIGVEYAKKITLKYNLPLIPIHHMEAHALTALLQFDQKLKFPFLCLLISGGHSQIALFKSIDNIFLFGDSLGAGPGELFDKIARLLKLKNLGSFFEKIPGGQAIEILSKLKEENKISKWFEIQDLIKKIFFNEKSCNFDYSKFKYFFYKHIFNLRKENLLAELGTFKNDHYKSVSIDAPLDETCEICYLLIEGLTQLCIDRLTRSIKFIEMSNILDEDVNLIEQIKLIRVDFTTKNSFQLPLVISGGVACNRILTENIKLRCKNLNTFYNESSLEIFVPKLDLCTDNAVMVAWNGVLKLLDDSKNNKFNFQLIDKQDMEQLDIYGNFPLGKNISDLIKKLKINLKIV